MMHSIPGSGAKGLPSHFILKLLVGNCDVPTYLQEYSVMIMYRNFEATVTTFCEAVVKELKVQKRCGRIPLVYLNNGMPNEAALTMTNPDFHSCMHVALHRRLPTALSASSPPT